MKHDTTTYKNSKMIGWLVPLVFLVSLAVFGLLVAYSFLNLLPDIPAANKIHLGSSVRSSAVIGVLAPTAASFWFLWPVFAWLRSRTTDAFDW